MGNRELARTISLPSKFLAGTMLLAARMLSIDWSKASEIIDGLTPGRAPTFGDLWRTERDDLLRVASQAGVIVSPIDAKSLTDLFRQVDPWTPICGHCGNFPLVAIGGKAYEPVPAGMACHLCDKGVTALSRVVLRVPNWAMGALVEPELANDVRSIPRTSIPLTDEAIRAWAGRIDPDLDRALKEAKLPLYGLLAYFHLKLQRFEKWGWVEASELLTKPREYGLWGDDVSRYIDEALRFLDAREVTNLPRAFLSNGHPRFLTGTATLNGTTYQLIGQMGQGDTSDVHLAMTGGELPMLALVKIMVTADEDLIAREVTNLRRLDKINIQFSELFRGNVPQLVEHGTLRLENGSSWPAMAYRYQYGSDWSLADVMREYPEGVNGPTLAWMANRLFEIMSWYRHSDLVHGAILPEHLIIHPADHTMMVIGWNLAVRDGERLLGMSIPNEGYYPEEAANDKVNHATDLAMACRTLIAVAGGNPANGSLPASFPEAMAKILVDHARYPKNPTVGLATLAHVLLDRWKKIISAEYGARKYVEFKMPRPAAGGK